MSAPPRLARRLIERLVDARLAEAVLGDLEEMFADERAREGPRRARFRYWRRALGAAWQLRRRHPIRPAFRGDSLMSTLGKDLVHGLRLFVAQPGYAWAAVATLALAIGANTLIFSIANILVVKPLPFERSDTLGWILATGPGATNGRGPVSLPEYSAYRDEASALTRLAAYRRTPITLRIGDDSERALAQQVIGDLQGLWGLRTTLGRRLERGDERPGAARVITLSHRFWTARLGAAPDVLGRSVLVDGAPHTIVGVIAPDIQLGSMAEVDLWLPLARDPGTASRAERQWRPIGRLADGATLADANAQVAAIAQRLAREWPDTNREWTARAGTTRDAIINASDWLVVTLLFTVVGLLLVLACANVMNLLIARLIARRQELAVRTALGATRGRVVRQIVAESLLIGLAGGLAGLGLAAAGLRGVHTVATQPFFQQLALDLYVIGFAFVLAFLTPLAFAVLPTLRVLRLDVRGVLNDGSTRSVGSRSAARGRAALVVVQVSLAVMLLVVATLVVRSMEAVNRVDVGYDPEPLLATEIDVPAWKLADDGAATALRRRIVERVAAIPGVEAVTLASGLPALHLPPVTPFDIDGRDVTPRDRPSAGVIVATTDYFAVFGVPILAGRAFDRGDPASHRAVTVISAEAARRYWGGAARAIGATLRLVETDGRAPLEAAVVGVAGDTANSSVKEGPQPVLYLLDEHRPTRRMQVVLRAAAPPSLAPALRAAIRDVDADLPLYQLRTVAATFADENSSNRLLTGLFTAFAVIALLLATAGLYGVISYAVSQRTPEIAVRMALGAAPGAIARDVVAGSLRLAAAGTVLGLAGALALARAIQSVLFGVTATDPATYLGAAVVAILAALVAAWLPMHRATHIDPIQNLRRA